jgi:hypothetical protein
MVELSQSLCVCVCVVDGERGGLFHQFGFRVSRRTVPLTIKDKLPQHVRQVARPSAVEQNLRDREAHTHPKEK